MWWPWMGIAIYIVLALVVPYSAMNRFERLTPMEENVCLFVQSDRDRMWEDRANWKCLGAVYFCPADERIFVPKRVGFGWTLNLGVRPGQIGTFVIVGAILVGLVVALICSADGCHAS